MIKLLARMAVFLISMSFGMHYVVVRQICRLFGYDCPWLTLIVVMTGATLNFVLAAICIAVRLEYADQGMAGP